MTKNPYQQLQLEFVSAGAKVLLSSGQAFVAYGIAAADLCIAAAPLQEENLNG